MVRCSDLGPILQAIMDLHELGHPNEDGSGVFNNKYITGISWLAQTSGLSTRRIWSIVHQETRHTGLSIADKLLTAADLSHLLQDGTLEVIPNPRMSQEMWTERMQERGCY